MSFGSFENVGSFIRDCGNKKLKYDEACLQVITDRPISFWSQYEECEGCILLQRANITSSHNFVIDTISPLRYTVKKDDNAEICSGQYENIIVTHPCLCCKNKHA